MKPRERILSIAADLFYAQGIRATGVDLIIARAEVAKATFYRHFPTKDDLVVAFLVLRDSAWRDWLKQAVERISADPMGRPLAVFDALGERFREQQFRGCAFVNTMVELADRSHPAHVAADNHKQAVIQYIKELLANHSCVNREQLARQLMMLMDGAIVCAVREGSDRAAQSAKEVATVLIDHASTLTNQKE